MHLRQLRPDATLVNTKSEGDVLFGCPPEIVKKFDFGQAPNIIVLTDEFVNNGHLMNEVEFPVYANYYLQGGKRVKYVGTAEQIERAKAILEQTLFWPEDAPEGKEGIEFFGGKHPSGRALTVDDFAEFITVNPGESTDIGRVKLAHKDKGRWAVYEYTRKLDRHKRIKLVGTVDTTKFTPPSEKDTPFPKIPLDPAKFGVTFIGTSSGFDPLNRTTSFILWANGKGIFVDPLADPKSELKRFGIESNDVPYIFLTHCHGDHDSGVLGRVLNGQKTKLITSRVIYETFLKKAKAQAGSDVEKYLEFIAAEPGSNIKIDGVTLEISRAFHPIPTIRFVAEYKDQASKIRRIAYSADTFFVPEKLREIFDGARLQELLSFGQGVDLLIHEAGMAPIHTPADELYKNTPVEKDKIVIVHTGSVPKDVPIKLARAGETIELVPSISSEVAMAMLEALSINPLLGTLPIKSTLGLLRSADLIAFRNSEKIIRKNDPGDHFYIIVSGRVSVHAGRRELAELGKGDYFGEIALLTESNRTASITAKSSGRLLRINKEAFDKILAEVPSFAEELKRVPQNRDALLKIALLQKLSRKVLLALAAKSTEEIHEKGTILIKQGEEGKKLFFILEGEAVATTRDGRIFAPRGPREVLGEISILRNVPTTANVTVTSKKLKALVLTREDVQLLIDTFPGFRFDLEQIIDERLSKI